MKVELLNNPAAYSWIGVKKRALITVGKDSNHEPSMEWKKQILRARHSPIRYLEFSFYIECPYWVSVHLSRHVHAQPYIKSQRNDRQKEYDRNAARQDETVSMIWDMNAEELITIANKRLCKKASKETREIVEAMCEEVKKVCPEFEDELVPMCIRENGCNEMTPCGYSIGKTTAAPNYEKLSPESKELIDKIISCIVEKDKYDDSRR